MPVITLTTDWGTTDYFVGALKGDILTVCADAVLVDICHHVVPYDLVNGAFIFRNSWTHFPKGTVHVSGVSAMNQVASPLIAIAAEGHYFIGTDNGFFSLVFDKLPSECYFILDSKGEKVTPNAKVIASSAAFLAKGGKLSEMGELMTGIIEKSLLQPVTEEKIIRGTVIYVDSYGNLVTNIKKSLFEKISKGRDFDIVLRTKEYIISEISNDYYEVGGGNLLAHYNESGFLEIAISYGNASGLLGLNYGDIIRIEFK